ncbi:MAG TPA: NADH:flavin oxidoreductase [Thermoanaerobaculia bacterium]|nr:NADH:flavin oxidoreductase [Thermoanaerobaculia bacterium]
MEVPNRIVMAPMATNRADKEGTAGPRLIRFLARRALGGCGMIIVESATVDAAHGSVHRNLRLDVDDSLPGLRQLVQRLHDAGAVAVAQLWHAGPRARLPAGGVPVSVSEALPGAPAARCLREGEIRAIVRKFIEAGERAAKAGFDAVEVHAAHGYLLHVFIDRLTNRRQGAYGGALVERFRILREIRAGLGRIRPGLPVLLRLSLRADDDFPGIGAVVEAAGFDAVDVRTGFSSAPPSGSTDSGRGGTLELARRLRKHVRSPILAGGRVLTPADAEKAVSDVGLDAVVLGRPLLADPDWARKALAGSSVVLCIYDCDPSCYSSFKAGKPLRCVHYGRRE